VKKQDANAKVLIVIESTVRITYLAEFGARIGLVLFFALNRREVCSSLGSPSIH
jgi:hypothetical protein